MALEAFGFSLAELRGFPIRLANDWELLEIWSSATNLALCGRGDVEEFDGSVDESCAAPARRVEYEVALLRGCALDPPSR